MIVSLNYDGDQRTYSCALGRDYVASNDIQRLPQGQAVHSRKLAAVIEPIVANVSERISTSCTSLYIRITDTIRTVIEQ
jgi:hypothetical protein